MIQMLNKKRKNLAQSCGQPYDLGLKSKEKTQKFWIRIELILILFTFSFFSQAEDSKQIAFIKADDMVFDPSPGYVISPQWEAFLSYVSAKKIKTSIGLICNSLEKGGEEYFSRLKELNNTGYFEFFNHGYDHVLNGTKENGETFSEFYNTPVEQQRDHLLKAQRLAREKLDFWLHTFGAPGNTYDDNTCIALEAVDAIKVWYNGNPSSGKLILDKKCVIESPLGFPNYEEFLRRYNPGAEYLIFQVHPRRWTGEQLDTFKKIIDYLMQRDVTFLTPYEYYRLTGTFYLLSVSSFPDSHIPIDVEPEDVNDRGSGETGFTRSFEQGTRVALTAPALFKGKEFLKWTVDGADQTGRLLQLEMDREHTVKLYYKIPAEPIIILNRQEFNFGCERGGPCTGSQVLQIENSGGGTLNWSAASESPWIVMNSFSGTGPGQVEITVNSRGLKAGTYEGTLAIRDPRAVNSPQYAAITLNVYNAGSTAPPFGYFATPVQGSIVCSSIPVTGWVLDDIGIDSVKIYSQQTYLGDAVFVKGARPDVEASYPGYPHNDRAGWGYMMLTYFLPGGGDGIYTLEAIAEDIEGHRVSLGTKTVIVDNKNASKPFGAIDTPAQGGTASGDRFVNWGWVLAPPPNKIPENGSTVKVFVDGTDLGHPVYNLYRSDIARLFPGNANSGGASAYFKLDTTAYENGIHTIAWYAVDDNGNSDGIGSRYFYIDNGVTRGSSVRAASLCSSGSGRFPGGLVNPLKVKFPYDDSIPVSVIKGYQKESRPVPVQADNRGIYLITSRELDRLVIEFPRDISVISAGMRAGHHFRELPAGSDLDTIANRFTWQPGPGFVGEYRFVFIIKDPSEKRSCKEIKINILPKSRQ